MVAAGWSASDSGSCFCSFCSFLPSKRSVGGVRRFRLQVEKRGNHLDKLVVGRGVLHLRERTVGTDGLHECGADAEDRCTPAEGPLFLDVSHVAEVFQDALRLGVYDEEIVADVGDGRQMVGPCVDDGQDLAFVFIEAVTLPEKTEAAVEVNGSHPFDDAFGNVNECLPCDGRYNHTFKINLNISRFEGTGSVAIPLRLLERTCIGGRPPGTGRRFRRNGPFRGAVAVL